MAKVSVTYNAPEDDSEVVTMGNVRFFDGQAVELDEDDHNVLLSKLRTNQHFDVSGAAAFESPSPIEGNEQQGGFSGASQSWK